MDPRDELPADHRPAQVHRAGAGLCDGVPPVFERLPAAPVTGPGPGPGPA